MTVDVTVEEVIDRPIELVSEFAADPDNVPVWYKNIQSVEWVTDKPLQLGSRIAFVARFMGKTLNYTYEITALEKGSNLVMRTSEGPFPMETSYNWYPAGGNATRMTLRNRGQPKGFSKLMAPFMVGMMRRETRKDLARLKAYLEAKET